MEVSEIQEQIIKQIRQAGSVLIALPARPSADLVSAGLALLRFLKKLRKEAVLATEGPCLESLRFLPDFASIKESLSGGKTLAVILDTEKTQLDELSYQVTDGEAKIFLKAKSGEFVPEDVSFESTKFPFDLAIMLGCHKMEDLGKLFETAADIFYETPKVNLDNHPNNQYFTPLSWVDMTAASVCEMVSEIMEKYEKEMIDEDVATCLLTGIVARTKSFQHAHTTPKAFIQASRLVALGGRQQEIIKELFKTRSLTALKLWGRTLARLKTDEVKKLAIATLHKSDFEKTQSSSKDLREVFVELMENLGGYSGYILTAEEDGNVIYFVSLHHKWHPEKTAAALGAKFSEESRLSGGFEFMEGRMANINSALAETRILQAIH